MRPDFIAFLERSGLSALTGLVPQPGAVYGIVLLVLGALFVHRARRVALSRQRALEIVLAAAVGAAIGTRLFFLVTTGELFHTSPSSWIDLSRGTASWGAWVGAISGALIYTRLARIPPMPIFDCAVSTAGLGEFIGRWSCVLAGDDFGRVSSAPWAVTYPEQSLAWKAQVAGGVISPEATASLPVHPFQFYLMINALVLFILISLVWRRTVDRPGYTFSLYLIGYGSTRFFWEFFRDPAAGGAHDLLSVSQWMCLGFVLTGVTLLVRGRGRSMAHSPSL